MRNTYHRDSPPCIKPPRPSWLVNPNTYIITLLLSLKCFYCLTYQYNSLSDSTTFDTDYRSKYNTQNSVISEDQKKLLSLLMTIKGYAVKVHNTSAILSLNWKTTESLGLSTPRPIT